MKTSRALIIVLVLAILGVFTLAWVRNRQVIKSPTIEQISIEEGCYTATNEKDIYTLNIQNIQGNKVSGFLSLKNFEKDSSSGIFNGIYNKDTGVLLADYSFQSEGILSDMQVIFKKSGDDFIRGYGSLNQDGTRFTDLENITYDEASPLSVFKKGECYPVDTSGK
ncbi:MAG TPA: hypothetical protein VK153_00690 [Candidatus Paceibacterota bacterium]|nr:hypothetical protein [Candidatus Paceibacterota bacterium]